MTKLVVLLFVVLVLVGCRSQSGPAIEVVVSNDFRGPVWIIEDPKADEDMKFVNGRYLLHIPKSGLVRITSCRPFLQWHQETARFADGTPLGGTGAELPKDTVAFRGGGSGQAKNGRLYMYDFVGTETEARKFFNGSVSPPVE